MFNSLWCESFFLKLCANGSLKNFNFFLFSCGEISSFTIYLLQRDWLVVTSMQMTRKFDLINNDDVVGNIHRGRGGVCCG